MRFRLVLLSLVSVALYGLLGVRSDVEPGARFLSPYDGPRLFEASVEFWGLWIALFALYVLALRVAARRSERSFFAIIFASAVFFRAAVFLGGGFDASEPEPSLFLYGPSPLTSAVARLGLGVLAERLLASIADLGALALAPVLLKGTKLPLGAAIIHGWNPLVIKEVAGSGRVEVVAFLLLLIALCLLQRRSYWTATFAAGASCTGPVMLVASLPPLLAALRTRVVLALGLAFVAWHLLLPETTWLTRIGWPPDSAIGGSVTRVLTVLANLFVFRSAEAPLAAAFIAWALFVAVRAARSVSEPSRPREVLVALGSFVLISPQTLPWAFVALAYLAAYSTNRGWLAFTATAPMTYLALGEAEWSFWLGFAQYFVPYALLIFYWLGRPPREAAGT